MFNIPKGDLTQRESEGRRGLHPTPAQRLESDVAGSIERAERADATRARVLNALAAVAITVGGFVELDEGIQRIDPKIMSMTPQQLASIVLQREVK